MTRIYIRNAQRAGEEVTESALYIDTDTLPDGVRVVERARNGCELADGTIARAGELTEWVYILHDDAIDWISGFLVPMSAAARWQWTQARLDDAIARALTERTNAQENHAKAERRRERTRRLTELVRIKTLEAYAAFFEEHAVSLSRVPVDAFVADIESRTWFVRAKHAQSDVELTPACHRSYVRHESEENAFAPRGTRVVWWTRKNEDLWRLEIRNAHKQAALELDSEDAHA